MIMNFSVSLVGPDFIKTQTLGGPLQWTQLKLFDMKGCVCDLIYI